MADSLMKYLVRRLCFMAVLSAPSGFLLNLMPASPRTAGNQHRRCSYYLSAPTMCVRNSRMYLQNNAHHPKDSKKKRGLALIIAALCIWVRNCCLLSACSCFRMQLLAFLSGEKKRGTISPLFSVSSTGSQSVTGLILKFYC